jgi:hypothetical protein
MTRSALLAVGWGAVFFLTVSLAADSLGLGAEGGSVLGGGGSAQTEGTDRLPVRMGSGLQRDGGEASRAAAVAAVTVAAEATGAPGAQLSACRPGATSKCLYRPAQMTRALDRGGCHVR